MTDKKLIPFDFDRAKAGDPVITKDGRKVRIVCFDFKSLNYPIIALIDNENAPEEAMTYSKDGFTSDFFDGNSYSLVMAPKTKTYWINIWKDVRSNEIYPRPECFFSEEFAKEAGVMQQKNKTMNNIDFKLLKTISFEIEE